MRQLLIYLRENRYSHFLFFLFFIFFSVKAAAIENSNLALLQVNFPGLKSVHTKILINDGIKGSATGRIVKKSTWKNDSTSVQVPQGSYDLIIQKGKGELIIDDVDCNSSTCSINNVVATLTINFSGLKSVHSSVFVSDSQVGLASGGLVTKKDWQTDQAVVQILRQVVDLTIKKGSDKIVVDNVDCRSGRCAVNELTATMIVSFPNMTSVNTSVHLVDNIDDSTSGEKVTHLYWQKNQAVLTVFRQKYDLKIAKKEETILVDNVDCTSGSCFVDDLIATLEVKFPGVTKVHTSVRLPDDIENIAGGKEVVVKKWQNNQVQFSVFKKTYDLHVTKGSGSLSIDNVDCSSGYCLVDELSTTLKVEFPGLSGVHVSVHHSDNQPGNASGGKITNINWQKEHVSLSLLAGVFDVKVRKGNDSIVVDNIDCTSNSCLIDDITAQLTAEFQGLNRMHIGLHIPDGVDKKITGKNVLDKNWLTDQVVFTVFKKKYDFSIKRKKSLPVIIDNVDCSSGSCKVNDLTAILAVKFPGIANLHTSIKDFDGQPGVANGIEFTHKNWQKNQTEITVLKQLYDVSMRQHKSEPLIVDKVDCRSGACSIDQITATMNVNFPGMRAVHTTVLVPDQQQAIAVGNKVAHLDWQKDQAEIQVLKQKFDLRITRGKSEPVVVDNLDCTSGSCTVSDITATMIVDFSGMKGMHTSVQVPDQQVGKVGGSEVTKLDWQTNEAVITVFKQIYDIQVKKGKVSIVVDNVDCTSGKCTVNELTSVLDIKFPGLQGVFSSVYLPDAAENTVGGKQVDKSNWKKNQTSFTLLREIYDVKVKHSIESIFDKVDCRNANCSVLIAGNVQVTLIDGDLNKPITEKFINAYEKMPDGTLNKVMTGKTTEHGLIHFTLPGITSGKVYVLMAYNPFGNKKSFFSSIISTEGVHKFIITADGENSLDQEPPELVISTPINGGSVSDQGFTVIGTANDNRKIDRLQLKIDDPVKGINQINAVYFENSSRWEAVVPTNMISVGADIILTATAFDQAKNQNSVETKVSVIEDNEGPLISITSHTDNDNVPVTGFLISGTVSDLTQVAQLNATLVDANLGKTMSNRPVDFSINNGVWTLVVENGLMEINDEESSEVSITFEATDTVGNTATKIINLVVNNIDYSTRHMINRITFGATPSLIKEVERLGAVEFLEQQLQPDSIDNSEFEAKINNIPENKEELQAWSLMHMAYSKRQLQEVMTWFWDNHFNTDINTKRKNAQGMELFNTVQYELDENQAFRANALGNFADLLEISAKSPAMLIYLDNISNVSGDSNENYAREVDELHTMGVKGGYTDQDVENGAEIFTGWHVQNGVFSFNDNLHTAGSYIMFEGTPQEVIIAEGGVEQGEQLLNALATHPSTAEFICSKLITLFVNDTPLNSLVIRCANDFLNNSSADDQIESVLRLIMLSAEFNDEENYRSKIKTPVEFVVGAVRNMNTISDATDLISPIRAMGIRLYENPVPTGWSEIGADWINAGLLIERIKWVNKFVRNEPAPGVSSTDFVQLYMDNNFETADGIVGFLFQLTVVDDFTELGRNNALNILGTDFDLNNADAKQKLQNLNGNVLSYPQYQFQ